MEIFLKKSLFFLIFLFAVSAWNMSSAVSCTVGESVPSCQACAEFVMSSPEDVCSSTMEYLLDCGKACTIQSLCDESAFSLESLKIIADVNRTVALSDVRNLYADIMSAVSSCRIVQHDSADYYVYMLERIIV